jgi:hypothetical protein
MASASMNVQASALTVIPSTAPTLREAAFDDYPRVARLQGERGLRVRSREEWRHLWEGNPAYIDRGRKWPIGWVLEAGSDIVGYVGNIPTRYALDGRQLTAGCGYSWVVTPAYSAYSILLLHEYLRQENAALCISTTASAISYKAHTALGAVPAPGGTWNRSSIWITTYASFVSSWLERKKWPMASVMSYPISAALYAKDAIRKRARHKKSGSNGHVEVECCKQFDERFDAFWEELRTQNPDKLLAERSRRALAWHFQFALHKGKLWIATVKEGSSLLAYAIFELLSNANDEVQRMALIDFQSTADKGNLFYPMLDWALERCSKAGIHLLETIGLCPRGIGDLGALAPYTIEQEGRPLYKARDASLAKRLSDPNVWTPCLYDGDASV